MVGFAVLLLVACAWDVARRRIPNGLNALTLVAGLATQGVVYGVRGGLEGLACAVLALVVLWTPWVRGWLGGGDVKLAVAAGSWLGLASLPWYLAASALAGGALAFVAYGLSTRAARVEMRANLQLASHGLPMAPIALRGGQGRSSVPYGVAFAAGAMACLVWLS